VETVIAEMRARGFPCDVISLDPWWMGDGPWTHYEWDTKAFPRPAEMMRSLKEQGVRTCLWIHPYVPKGSRAHAEGSARGYFVRKPDGSISPPIEGFSGTELAAVDFTNPEACKWFESKLQALLDMGVAVFKTDFGEQAPVDAVYHDGRSGLEMHNLYPLLYNRTAFELSKRNFGRGFVWARSAYAGSQRYPVQWGGDSYGSLDQMASQVRGLLSYGMSGVPFCSHDVGGFDYSPRAFDEPTQEGFPKDPAVYIRWLQFGVFSSHIRAHGKQPREPWTYGSEAEEIARRYLSLRYRLLPYIYSEAVKSTRSGLPMVRPMVLEYQEDPNTERLDLQYLFGESFLVVPVVTSSGRYRVYLPAGDWVNYWTKRRQRGGRWIDAVAPLDELPLWVKAGAIVPMGPDMRYVEEKPLDPLTVELYFPRGSAQTVVEDEDRPSIPVRYERAGDRLYVEVGAAPGQVELILYGVAVLAAAHDGRALVPEACGRGQAVRFDGTRPGMVEFRLRP
jgi:alpha-D-xyloside xylohydrolase